MLLFTSGNSIPNWCVPSGGVPGVNSSCCYQSTKEWEGLNEGEGPEQLLCHSKYNNGLWYRHKDVEPPEPDVCRVKGCLRRRPSQQRRTQGSENWAAHSRKRKRSSRKREEPEDTHTKTHCDTRTEAGSNTCFTSLQPLVGKLDAWDEDLVRPGEDMACCLFWDWKASLTKKLDLFISAIREFNGPVPGYAIIAFVDSAADWRLYWKRRPICVILLFWKQTFRLHIVGCSRFRTGGGEDTPAWISVPRDGSLHHEVTHPPNKPDQNRREPCWPLAPLFSNMACCEEWQHLPADPGLRFLFHSWWTIVSELSL